VLGVEVNEESAAMKVHARVLAAFVGALLVVTAACGGDDGTEANDDDTESENAATSEQEPESSTGDESTTTAPLSPEDEVIRDYEAASAAFSAAANPPNPDAPELAEHFTGSSLTRYQTTLRSLQEAGATAENSVEHRVLNVTIVGETAQVQDCFVDTTEQFSATTGESLGGASTTTMHVDVELQRVDGVWKVAERTERNDPCPAT
jgi:hypothetical protein